MRACALIPPLGWPSACHRRAPALHTHNIRTTSASAVPQHSGEQVEEYCSSTASTSHHALRARARLTIRQGHWTSTEMWCWASRVLARSFQVETGLGTDASGTRPRRKPGLGHGRLVKPAVAPDIDCTIKLIKLRTGQHSTIVAHCIKRNDCCLP